MKSIILLLTSVLLVSLTPKSMSVEPSKTSSGGAYRVVFEVTADGQEKWLGALRNVENARNSLKNEGVIVEVVTHGKGLGMLVAKNVDESAELQEKISQLNSEGVVFAACENTMRKQRLEARASYAL